MTWFDLAVCICLIIGLIKGLIDGFVKQLVAVVSLFLAFVFSCLAAGYIRSFVENTLQWEISVSPQVMNAMYYILAFLVILAFFSIIGILVSKLINATPVGVLNKIAGGISGVGLWLLCLSFLLNMLLVFDSESRIINKQIRSESYTFIIVKEALPTLYPYLKDFF